MKNNAQQWKSIPHKHHPDKSPFCILWRNSLDPLGFSRCPHKSIQNSMTSKNKKTIFINRCAF